jgi:hypothetical protein
MEGGQRTGDLERFGRLLATYGTSLGNDPSYKSRLTGSTSSPRATRSRSLSVTIGNLSPRDASDTVAVAIDQVYH